MKVLCVGHACYDISVPVDEYPIENLKYRVNDRYECGGGPASNAAYLLGKWGCDTAFAGAVGNDDFGTKIKKEFDDIRVNTDNLEVSYDKPTSISFVLINKKNGSRTLFNVAKEYPQLKRCDITEQPEYILIDGHEYNASITLLNKFPDAISVIDAGRCTLENIELCKKCKHIVCSQDFAEAFSKTKMDFQNPQTLVDIYKKLASKFVGKNIVVTLGDKGALYALNDDIKVMPGIKAEVKDTTGAGDIFHGAYLFGLINGYDIEKTIRFANIASGLSVQAYGSRSSIPNIAEVLTYYNNKFGAPVTNEQK